MYKVDQNFFTIFYHKEFIMTSCWIGIDIAKHKFDVSILLEEGKKQHKIFTNDLGLRTL